jgi:hypothetical protein
VQGAVDETNFKIQQVSRIPLTSVRETMLAHYYSPDVLAGTVRRKLPTALWAIDGLELKLLWKNAFEAQCGKRFGHFASPTGSVFSHASEIPDPRQLGRMAFMRSSMIQVHGTRMGTDKIAHFVSMGYINYCTYRHETRSGVDSRTALRHTVGMAADGPLGESGILGGFTTGVYSNADMAANYLGMKFYLNLMKPVRLNGEVVPPMVKIRNGMLALQPGVRADGPYFAQFISDHLDEVLNPSLYDSNMREGVRQGVRENSREIVAYYAGDDPDKRNPEYFNGLMVEYATYYGEPYGHCGQFENLISVGDTCFSRRCSSRGIVQPAHWPTATDRR